MRRIRIIEKEREPSFRESLESIAREVSSRPSEERESSPLKALDREIRLALDQIDTWKSIDRALKESLRREEFDLEQDLRRLDVSRRYQSPNYARERLKGELRDIEKERRELASKHEEKLQPLHDHLLELLNRRKQLSLDGH